MNLTAAYALLGKMNEARSSLAQARQMNPSLTMKWLQTHGVNTPAKTEGLRKAGLPEE